MSILLGNIQIKTNKAYLGSDVIYNSEPLSQELFSNPDFDTDLLGWNSVASNQIIWSPSYEGSAIMNQATGSNCRLLQSNIMDGTGGVFYRLEYTIEEINGGIAQFQYYNGSSYINFTADMEIVGTHAVEFECQGNTTNRIAGLRLLGTGFEVYISRISLKQIL